MYVFPMLPRGTADLLVACCAGRFYHGCSTFLPVFDASVDTYDALHERSPFAVDVICMVAAKVRDGGGKSHRLDLLQLCVLTFFRQATPATFS